MLHITCTKCQLLNGYLRSAVVSPSVASAILTDYSGRVRQARSREICCCVTHHLHKVPNTELTLAVDVCYGVTISYTHKII